LPTSTAHVPMAGRNLNLLRGSWFWAKAKLRISNSIRVFMT